MEQPKNNFKLVTDKKNARMLLPNMLTLIGVCIGLTSIRFALSGEFHLAIIAIIFAALIDGLDGRIARLIKGTSKVGKELDSLTDMISFGVAPAFIMYFWKLNTFGRFGWLLCLVYVICVALRLARFNSELSDKPNYAKNYFSGIPTPAAAFLALLPITGLEIFNLTELKTEFYICIWISIIAIGMVSNLPTFSGKVMLVPRKFVIPFLILLGILSHYIISDPTKGFTLLVLIYIITIPISPVFYYRLRSKFEKNNKNN